jgi:uncharacterized protein (TIGR02186 family)
MRGQGGRIGAGVALILGLLAGLLLGGRGAAASGLHLSPQVIEIGTFFEGAQLTVSAEIPQGAQAIMGVVGGGANEYLMRKGRRGGLWMNVGEIQVQGVPEIYLIMSSNKDLLYSGNSKMPFGYSALRKKVTFSGSIAPQEVGRFFQDFLKLKESNGLYASRPGAVKVTKVSSGLALAQGRFYLPAQIPPGDYAVRLAVVQAGEVRELREARLDVRMVGFPALLTRLAYEQAALFGIIAIVIAIAAGFLMGFLFKGKAEH